MTPLAAIREALEEIAGDAEEEYLVEIKDRRRLLSWGMVAASARKALAALAELEQAGIAGVESPSDAER